MDTCAAWCAGVSRCLLVVVLAGAGLCEQPPAAKQRRRTTGSPIDIQTQINDAAAMKLLWLDDAWAKIGKQYAAEKVKEFEEKVARKYGYKDWLELVSEELKLALAKPAAAADLPSEVDFESGASENGWYVSLKLPDQMYGLVPGGRKLPATKFAAGWLTFNFRAMAMSFSDGAKCLIDGKVYTFRQGVWSVSGPPAQ